MVDKIIADIYYDAVCESPSWDAVNRIIDTFLANTSLGSYAYLGLEFSATGYKFFNKQFGPECINDAVKEAFAATNLPYLIVVGNEYFSFPKTETPYTKVFDDGIIPLVVYLTRPALAAAGYMKPINGPAGILEYLARINRLSGFCPDHFFVLKNTHRYLVDSSEPWIESSDQDWKEYKQSIASTIKGLGLKVKERGVVK